MPSELFGASRVPLRPRARSSRVFIVSVFVHLLVLVALLVAQLTGALALPTPVETLAYVQPDPIVRIADPPSPPSRSRQPASRADSQPVASASAAPVVAPRDITIETDTDGLDRPGPPVSLIDGGLPGVPEGVGRVEAIAPAPPAEKATAPIRLHSGIRAPTKLVHVPPAYPAIARTARVQGLVIIEATIDTDGAVVSTRVLKSVPLLDQAAVDAVRQWRFTPTLLNNVAVPIIMTVTVNFALEP